VDLIVCAGDPTVRAAQQATKTIPILALADDMVRSGFVASLAEPGGNTTGISILSTELDGKRQEILLEVVPGIRRLAALADANAPYRDSSKRCRKRRTPAALICPFTGWQKPMRSQAQSMRRRVPAPQRSTCWHPRCFMPIARSSCRA